MAKFYSDNLSIVNYAQMCSIIFYGTWPTILKMVLFC